MQALTDMDIRLWAGNEGTDYWPAGQTFLINPEMVVARVRLIDFLNTGKHEDELRIVYRDDNGALHRKVIDPIRYLKRDIYYLSGFFIILKAFKAEEKICILLKCSPSCFGPDLTKAIILTLDEISALPEFGEKPRRRRGG